MSAQRIDLPSGGWVALKDPRHVPVRTRRPVVVLMGKFDSMGIDGVDEMLCVAGAALIAQWSFGEQITADTIADVIDVEDADVILTALMPLVTKLAPNFSPDGVGDPDSPTPA